jgi:ABC-type branched-subunit amino acid transport system ATPase component
MDDLVIETRELTKVFAGFTAVQDVNLRIRRGSRRLLNVFSLMPQGNQMESNEP